MKRPDLARLDPDIRAYIEYLEHSLESANLRSEKSIDDIPENLEPIETQEAPTTRQVITLSHRGRIKRTERHLYPRQRRGGMGVFELEVLQNDAPSVLAHIDESQSLLFFTDQARTFRLPVSRLESFPLRSKGEALPRQITLENGEHIVAALPAQAEGYVTLLSATGYVRSLRHHLFGEYMKPGTPMLKAKEFGSLADVCWSTADSDILIATQGGMAIRFNRNLVPPKGIQAIRLAEGDQTLAVTSVSPDSGVFFLGADGLGIIRQMSSFAANKSPGGSGKIALRTTQLAASLNMDAPEDILIITHLSKIIRFSAREIPVKESAVQGVRCMALRGDSVVAAART
jgi:DNA gyrase subunit A